MRMKKRGLVVAFLACTLGLAALSGCTPTPAPTPIPTSATDAPVFESDEEALGAATEAYAAYLSVSDIVGAEGGTQPDLYETVARAGALDDARKSADQFLEAKAKSVGTTAFEIDVIQSWGTDSERGTYVTVYLCDDVSGLDVIDSSGASLVQSDRPDRTPFEVTVARLESSNFFVIEKALWEGTNFC